MELIPKLINIKIDHELPQVSRLLFIHIFTDNLSVAQ